MQKQKLLYIGNKLSLHGRTITSIETLGSFLGKAGFEMHFASTKRNKALRLLDMFWQTIKLSKKVSHVLIDTYSTQNFYYAVAVAYICRILKVKYVPILRGGNLPERLRTHKNFSKKLFNGAATNVVPSMYLLKAFQNAGYLNITYIPNSIELEHYPYQSRHNLKPNLLWVRSFSEIYNPFLALKLVEILLENGLAVNLCMVGPEKDGSLEECKKIALEKRLPIVFPGKLSKADWINLSNQYDIFINTTNFDNTPVSVIEAMALGLPIISTNVGGLPFLIENEREGILVPPDDADLFAAAIQRLLEEPELAATLSKNGRLKVEKFDWEVVKHSWISLLNN